MLLAHPLDLAGEFLLEPGPSGLAAMQFQRALGAVDFVEGRAKLGHHDLVGPFVVLAAADAADGHRPDPPSMRILGDARGIVA